MTVKHKCSKRVWRRIGWYPCSRPATIESDGIWYCWQHDPERVKAKAIKRMTAWQAEQDRLGTVCARRTRNAKLAALVNEETADLVTWLAIDIEILREFHVDTLDNDDQRDEKINAARSLASRIREALEETE